jgi:hypothetical protein
MRAGPVVLDTLEGAESVLVRLRSTPNAERSPRPFLPKIHGGGFREKVCTTSGAAVITSSTDPGVNLQAEHETRSRLVTAIGVKTIT